MKEEGIPTEPFKERWSRYDNVMACFLSQYYLWMHCVQINENILIFEHDAVVRGEIPLDIPFKGVLTFGHPSYGNFQTPSFIGVNKLVSKQHFPGNHCYLIKPAAAEVLIETAKRDPAPADVFLHNNRFDFLEEYYPWPVYAVDTFSTVQNRNGIQAKHQYQKLGQEYKLV
jgi:GR25 family glycosyltransferase involved in LPS biosynthesis